MWGVMKSITRDGFPRELAGLIPPAPLPAPLPPHLPYVVCVRADRGAMGPFVLNVRCVSWYKANTRVVVNLSGACRLTAY